MTDSPSHGQFWVNKATGVMAAVLYCGGPEPVMVSGHRYEPGHPDENSFAMPLRDFLDSHLLMGLDVEVAEQEAAEGARAQAIHAAADRIVNEIAMAAGGTVCHAVEKAANDYLALVEQAALDPAEPEGARPREWTIEVCSVCLCPTEYDRDYGGPFPIDDDECKKSGGCKVDGFYGTCPTKLVIVREVPSPPTEEGPSYIEWWDGSEFNARHFRHPGCTEWIAPEDGSPAPHEDTECPECIRVLPVRPASPVARPPTEEGEG